MRLSLQEDRGVVELPVERLYLLLDRDVPLCTLTVSKN